MNILYDHQTYDFLTYGGIPRYFYELTKGISKLNHKVTNTIKFSDNIFTKDDNYFNVSPFLYGKKLIGKRTIRRYYNKRASIKHIKKNDYDIFHPTYYDPYFLKQIKNKPYVVTFHDLIHELFSDRYNFLANDQKTINFKKEILKKTTHIISVSETTKKDLIDIYNVDANKIQVIGLGNSLRASDIIYNDKNQQEYILYVGNRIAWKNFNFCIEALASVLKQNGLLFICAGGGDFTNDENELINKLKLNAHIRYESITDVGLASLYGNAYAFILPSLYEGFGIPVLEAFACRCPCLLSNSGSLPEVGGDAAMYFDPEDASSMQDALNKLVSDNSLRDSMIEKGEMRLKHYNWDITCQNTLQLYQSIIDKSV